MTTAAGVTPAEPDAVLAPCAALHVPDEPLGRKADWVQALHGGRALPEVVGGDDGVASWMWDRWRTLAATGVDEGWLRTVAVSYRREIGLWLAGDRTWAQCCSGLLGRISRRLPPPR